MAISSRAFLKDEGFLFDKKSSQIDRIFLKKFSKEKSEEIERIWRSIHDFGMPATLLYSIPETSEQANILWSYDLDRYVVTLDWIATQIARIQPKYIVEMGCGTGTLLRFLAANFEDIRVRGLDSEVELVRIAQQVPTSDVIHADYLSDGPTMPDHDLIICNFGFDLSRFKPSTTRHSLASVGQSHYCPGCSDDFYQQFKHYTNCWRKWSTSNSQLLLTGRLPNFGYLRGVVMAAADSGWLVNPEKSTVLKTGRGRIRESFPALVFESSAAPLSGHLVDAIERVYSV